MAQTTIETLDKPKQGELPTGQRITVPVANAPGTVMTGQMYVKQDGSLVVRALEA